MNAALRFLVVDDFTTMRRMLRGVLTELGYTDVVEAEDGESALAVLRKGGIDILLTDWNMPGMTGLALLQAVRADAQLGKLPVLLVTAEGKREQIIEAVKSGVDGYIIKPFTAQTLRDKIEKVLASRQSG